LRRDAGRGPSLATAARPLKSSVPGRIRTADHLGYGEEDGWSPMEAQTIHLRARKELANGLDPKEEQDRRIEAAEAVRRERPQGPRLFIRWTLYLRERPPYCGTE